MLKGIIGLAAAAALAGCATVAADGGGTPSEMLSVEMNSWGKPVAHWQVGADGAGRYTVSRETAAKSFHEYDLVTTSFRAAPADFARLEALLRPARPYAGREIPCELTITDAVYGRILWQRQGAPGEVRFNMGCTSRTADPIHANVAAALDLVETLAASGTVVEVKEVRGTGR